MGGIRVHWRGVGKVAAVVVGAIVALRVLPGVFEAPEVPPLAPDVGLPRVVRMDEEEPPVVVRKATPPRPRVRAKPSHGVEAATAVIGTTRRLQAKPHRSPDRARQLEKPTPPPPPPPPVPPAPEPTGSIPVGPPPEPAPEPVPSDGSMEFAPH